jgi:hypothetical protein
VKGQGLCKMAMELKGMQDDEDKLYEEGTDMHSEIYYIPVHTNPWHYELRYCLTHGSAPQYLEPKKRRALRLKSVQYQLVNGKLFRKNYDHILLRCLEKTDAKKVIQELHNGPTRGHFGGDTTTHKIPRVGYHWPTMFKDAYAHFGICEVC